MTCLILQTHTCTGYIYICDLSYFVFIFITEFWFGVVWLFWRDIIQVGRAGRFGTKGLAITFVSCSSDVDVLNNVRTNFVVIILLSVSISNHVWCDLQVQSRFEIDIKQLPEQIDTSTYSKCFSFIDWNPCNGFSFWNLIFIFMFRSWTGLIVVVVFPNINFLSCTCLCFTLSWKCHFFSFVLQS
jgi:hypothetical protein